MVSRNVWIGIVEIGNIIQHFVLFFPRGLIDHAKYYCIWCLDNMLTKGKWFLFVMEVCLSYQAVSVTVINYLGTKPMQHRTVSRFFFPGAMHIDFFWFPFLSFSIKFQICNRHINCVIGSFMTTVWIGRYQWLLYRVSVITPR